MAKAAKPRTTAARRRPRRLQPSVVRAVDAGKYFGVRAGGRSDHRFIAIWAVVVDGRVYARSWTVKPEGWNQAFLEDPLGILLVGERKVRIRAVPARSERLRDLVEEAYAAKYDTPGALKYVRGFRSQRRRESTLEFQPR